MNLNKYDSQGYLYTHEEAKARAQAFFVPRYLCHGYKRIIDSDPRSPTYGSVIPEDVVKPYNVGRNAAKRAAKADRAKLLRRLDK